LPGGCAPHGGGLGALLLALAHLGIVLCSIVAALEKTFAGWAEHTPQSGVTRHPPLANPPHGAYVSPREVGAGRHLANPVRSGRKQP